MTLPPVVSVCIVCRRGAELTVVDGVPVRICSDCEGDRFRREEAQRRAASSAEMGGA